MTYQRKLKPAIYADLIAHHIGSGSGNPWTADSGTVNTDSSLVELSDGMPKIRCLFDTNGSGTEVVLEVDFGSTDNAVYAYAVLNHNLNASGAKLEIRGFATDNYAGATVLSLTDLVGTLTSKTVDNDGSNVLTSESTGMRYYWIRIYPVGATFTDDIEIGQICLCRRWLAPHGPDMGGTRPLDFSGVKLQQTRGGGNNAVVDWLTGSESSSAPFGQPFRYDHAGTSRDDQRMAGRRSWSHTLSLIDDDDFFTSDLSVSVGDAGTIDLHDILTITGGQRHPFIFTPDSASTTTGDYMWGRFSQASVNPEENSQHVLSVDLSIQEEF